MLDNFIPLSVPNLKGNELEYVTNAIKEEWVSTGGKYISDFESKISAYVKSRGAVACQSGTSGIHLSLIAMGVGEGDEVFVPTLTFIAAVNPVKYVGADPIFMDCDDSLCMDMEKLDKFCEEECYFDGNKLINKITGKHIKAIILVHVFGNMANMEAALEIKKKYNLAIIEDATEALGSYIESGALTGKFAGTIGDVGIFSFNGNKIITTGGGGMIVSNDLDILNKIKYLSTQAKDDSLYYIHNEIGYNYRMTNLQAAIGLAQLERLDDFIKIKHDNYDRYESQDIHLLAFSKNVNSNKWFYSYITDYRDRLIKHLNNKGVQTRPVWNLNHLQKPYINFQNYKIEKALYFRDKVINLPCSTNLSFNDIDYIAGLIKDFVNVEI